MKASRAPAKRRGQRSSLRPETDGSDESYAPDARRPPTWLSASGPGEGHEANNGLVCRAAAEPQQDPPLLQLLQFFTGFEANRLAGRNRDLRSGARVAADAGLPRADVKDPEAAQFYAFAVAESALHALENCFDGHLGFSLGDAG